MKAQRPRSRLFKSAAAEATFAAVTTLTPTEQHAVLKELQRRFNVAWPKSLRDQQRMAVHALHRAAEMIDGPVSVKTYEALRRAHPEEALQPVATLKRWLGAGTWSEALQIADLPDASEAGETLGVEYGPRFTADEAIAAVKAATDALGRVPSFTDYYAYAQRPEVRERARLPLSLNTFIRKFGSWPNALVAAGLRDPDEGVRRIDGTFWSGRYRTTDEECVTAIREVATRIGHSPSSVEYERERQLILDETSALGMPRAVPSIQVFYRRFGCWANAIVAAGYDKPPVRIRPRAFDRIEYQPDTIHTALRAAHDALGEPLAKAAYERWRLALIEQEPSWREALPSAAIIVRRLGRWVKARAIARGDHE